MSNRESFTKWLGPENAASTPTHALFKTTEGELVVLRSSMDSTEDIWMWSSQFNAPIEGVDSDFSVNTNRAPSGFPNCDLATTFGQGLRMLRANSNPALERLLQSIQTAPAVAQETPAPFEEKFILMSPSQSTNLILYGPPGTGKTFTTASRAVELCDGSFPAYEGRAAVMLRYEELRKEGRVTFITFHQSYGYEEFVEGLRPHVNVTGQVAYSVIPGVFRRACDSARLHQLVKPGLIGKPLQQRTIFKMSLGASWSDEGVKVFQYGLKNQCVLLGYGDDLDFSECFDVAAIREHIEEETPGIKKLDSHVRFVNSFKNELKIGDIIIVSDGNKFFRGVAEVTGEYEFVEDAPFHQMRPVKWLAVFEPSQAVGDIFHKGFSMQTLYKLSSVGLNFEHLEALLSVAAEESPAKPHVLIIDEINRANISKVFGELITLLEPDKREGSLNAITVKLPYSGEDFTVPANLHVIGTMNTADRSIALLDTALRRRFDFEELVPDPSVLRGRQVEGVDLEQLLKGLNERIEVLFDRDHRIGHAFFIGVQTHEDLDSIFRRKVLPLLQEYFYENWSNVRRVLNDYGDGDFITRQSRVALPADGEESYPDEPRIVYGVNKILFPIPAYKRIYGGV